MLAFIGKGDDAQPSVRGRSSTDGEPPSKREKSGASGGYQTKLDGDLTGSPSSSASSTSQNALERISTAGRFNCSATLSSLESLPGSLETPGGQAVLPLKDPDESHSSSSNPQQMSLMSPSSSTSTSPLNSPPGKNAKPGKTRCRTTSPSSSVDPSEKLAAGIRCRTTKEIIRVSDDAPRNVTGSTGKSSERIYDKFLHVEYYATICRLCEAMDKQECKWANLFAIEHEQLRRQIQSLTSIEINRNDRLPKLICTQCITSLEQAYNFQMLCEKTNKKLLHEIDLIEKNNFGDLPQRDTVYQQHQHQKDDLGDADFDSTTDDESESEMEGPLFGQFIDSDTDTSSDSGSDPDLPMNVSVNSESDDSDLEVASCDLFNIKKTHLLPDIRSLTFASMLPDLTLMNKMLVESTELPNFSSKTLNSSSRPTVRLPAADLYGGANPFLLGHKFPLPYEFVQKDRYDILHSKVDKTPLITRHVLTPEGMIWDRQRKLKRTSTYYTPKDAESMYISLIKSHKRTGFDFGHSSDACDLGNDPEANDMMNIFIENTELNRTINKNLSYFIRKQSMQSDYTVVLKGKMHVIRTEKDGSQYVHYDLNGPDGVAVPEAFWRASASFVGNLCTNLFFWIMENVAPPRNSIIEDYYAQPQHVWQGSGSEIFKEHLPTALLLNGKINV